MNIGEIFHRARTVTPFADRAAYDPKAHLLLQIAIQHGYKDVRQFAKAAASEFNLTGESVLLAMQSAANEIEHSGGQVDFMQLLNMYLPGQEAQQKEVDLESKRGINFIGSSGKIVRKKY